jgi:hypothetical protein
MKTPKRNTGNPRAVDLYAQRHSRWKRKNRIKQLKHTIARMKEENARLWDGFSRMSVRCCDLYNTFIYDHPGEIHVHLTPGEIKACFNALISQTRFTTTEQRKDNESALVKLNQAYNES